jgi:hypothetical protein
MVGAGGGSTRTYGRRGDGELKSVRRTRARARVAAAGDVEEKCRPRCAPPVLGEVRSSLAGRPGVLVLVAEEEDRARPGGWTALALLRHCSK